jgi:hypothetical protein
MTRMVLGESASVHRVVLFFAGRTQSEIDEIASVLHARAQEHGGFVGVLVDEHEVDVPPDRPCSS